MNTATSTRPSPPPVTPPAPTRRRWTRADTYSTLVIAALAFLTRFVGLTSASVQGTPVFDEKHYRLTCGSRVYGLGDPVRVRIESADVSAHKIEMRIVEEK